ncbi:MAG: ABC transporter substrate-binding protein [Nitrosomonadales bacterium]|nr:MAG: ABC transporter substrate-binding protein [Nitrosomonadales bacterium]
MATSVVMKAVLTMAVLALFSGRATAETMPPDQLMLSTTNQMVDAIKNDKDIQSGNLEKLSAIVKEIVLPHIDLDRMSHSILGKYWEDASGSQREAFKIEFATFISYLYSTQLPDYHDQTVKFELPQGNADSMDVVLTMLILQSGNLPEKAYFSLGKVGDEWKIYDINTEGVSFMSLYRGQFLPLAKQSGMDALIQKLAEKNKRTPSAVVATKQK